MASPSASFRSWVDTKMETQLSRNWIGIALKVVNSLLGVSGFALLLCSLWMIGVCIRQGEFSWFVFAALVTGSILSLIACTGHVASTHVGSGVCLSCYMLLLFIALMLESVVAADVLLNDDWEKAFPKDRSDMFDDFVDLVESNYGFFQCISILVWISQVTSFALAMALKFSGENRARINDERLRLVENQPRFISNKYVEY